LTMSTLPLSTCNQGLCPKVRKFNVWFLSDTLKQVKAQFKRNNQLSCSSNTERD
jgi:hypothetical protein